MQYLRSIVSGSTYPVILGGSVGTAWWLLSGPVRSRGHEVFVVAGILLVVTAVVLLLQRLAPGIDAWRAWSRDAGMDVAHGIVSTLGGAALSRVLFFGAIAWAAGLASDAGWGIWPDSWPLIVQLPFAVLVSDFIVYWLHRAGHRSGALWRLHELHHTSEQLYALSSGRTHLVWVALSTALTTAPLAALGADPAVLALLSVLHGANGVVQHSNIDLRCHPWSWVFATADMHRWHHSVERVHQESNFGNILSIWDRLFGTLDVPDGPPAMVGLDEPTPRGFLMQLVRPFLPRPPLDAPPALRQALSGAPGSGWRRAGRGPAR